MITHLEADILECEVKWALESITTNKASGGDGIPEHHKQNNKTARKIKEEEDRGSYRPKDNSKL